MSAERRLSGRRLYEGRVVSLRVDEVELEGGRHARREVVEHRGAVAVVAVDEDGRITFVRQHRYAVGQDLLELPAGTLDPGEAPETTALRELREETGLTAARVTPLMRFFLAPGYSTEEMRVFVADGLRQGEAEPEDDEGLVVERRTLDEALAMLDSGVFRDAKTIAALLAYARARGAV